MLRNKTQYFFDYIKIWSYNIDNLSEMEKFLLIGIEEDPRKALEYVGDDIVMQELNSRISEFCLSDDLRESYDKEWALKDQARRDGIEEGIEQGIEKGIEQGKCEIITKLLISGMTIEEISKITEISVEEIQTIKEENNI